MSTHGDKEPAVIWREEKDDDNHYTNERDQRRGGQGAFNSDDEKPPPRTYIMGPPSKTFPIAEGWAPSPQHPGDKEHTVRNLPPPSIPACCSHIVGDRKGATVAPTRPAMRPACPMRPRREQTAACGRG